MLSLFSPAAWSRAADEARAGPYVAGARTTRPWLRLLLFVLLSAAFMLAAVVGLGALTGYADAAGWIDLEMFDGSFTASNLMDESTFIAAVAVVLFVLAISLLLAAMVAYQRGPGAFLWPRPEGGLGLFLTGFAVMFLIALVLLPVMTWLEPGGTAPVLDPADPPRDRLIYAGAVTGGLLIAAAAEEIVFRGVLLRITGGLTQSLVLILVVNGLLFAAVHWDPDPTAFVARAASGMVWAWAALRLGSLAFAIGAHLANNLFIALLLAPISVAAMPGQPMAPEGLAIQAVTLIVVLVFVEVLARRRPVRLPSAGAVPPPPGPRAAP